ncbi:small ribosomal subunit protein mS27 [Aquarana catesbeiana]|uniref:small ribosomal subunit protein mS27 n=1 Tax=Aquarana catesbeiana TaxID=8400 RepID=UPI003CCA3BDD
MAASMVYRRALVSWFRNPAVTPLMTGKRFILSSAYTSDSAWEKWDKEPHDLVNLAYHMDKNYERKFPVSSLTIAQFVDNIQSREEIDQAEYYLYKFRHSPNCWYLRDWTIHGWIRKCLKYGAPEKALYTLQNKVQYGIFPNDFTFNLLLDAFIKKENFEDAASVVFEIMLQESFDNVSTQLLSLYALHKYLSGNPQLTWVLEKNLGASLLLAGMNQENTVGYSSQLYGNTLLGKVELSQGLRAVYTQMPLMWKPGYFQRALNVMEKVSQMPGEIKITKDAIEILKLALESAISGETEKVASENDEVSEDTSMCPEDSDKTEAEMLPEYLSRFQELHGKLESLDKIETTDLLNLTTQLVLEKLPECEKPDIEKYEAQLREWQNDEAGMIAREKEIREKAKEEYEARQAAKSAAQ